MRERLVDCYSRQTDQRNPSAADNDPYSYLEVYRIGFPLQAARPKFRPSSEALACLNNQNFSKVCYRVKPANAQPNRMFAHSSYTKHSALSVLSLKVTWRLYRSQPYGDLRRLGDYATASKLLHAHRKLNGTRRFRKLFFYKIFLIVRKTFYFVHT